MFIKFESVEISGYQSIEYANINLTEQGIVLVKGVNKYEANTSSNGAGKSSVFEAIYFAIYGKTTSGISDPTNRYIDKGCFVNLKFSVDNVEYRIIRSIKDNKYKTGLYLFKNEEDMSGRNKTDTEKIIQNDIFDFSNDIFLSIIFLSQGFNNKITSLSPSARKDRLENLTRTSARIDDFKQKLLSAKSKHSDNVIKLNNKKSELIGTKNAYENEKFRLQQIINKAQNTEKPEISKEDLNSKIQNIRNTIDEINKSRIDLNLKYNQLKSKEDEAQRNFSDCDVKISALESELRKMQDDSVCPLCKQHLNSELRSELLESKQKEIEKLTESYEEYKTKYLSASEETKAKLAEIRKLETKGNSLQNSYNSLNSLLDKYADIRDVTNEINRVSELDNEIELISRRISMFEDSISKEEDLQSAAKNLSDILTKQFRSYLLNNVVDFINNRVKFYSNILFSNANNDIINVVNDSSKIEIFLGDANYGSLSGGEKRKVDLALVLAQRDLAMSISGTSSNILVMDEVYDNLDDLAMSSVMNMFNESTENIDSMFIISHRLPKEVPFDAIMQVTKDSNRLSHIEFVGSL